MEERLYDAHSTSSFTGHWLLVTVFFLLLTAHCSLLTADDAADLKAVVDKFFAAYTKKDLDGFMALWSAKSPDYASRKQTMQQTFAAAEKIEVKNLTVRKVTVEGEKAKVWVAVEMSAVSMSGEPVTVADFGNMQRILHCVKENEAWKVWRYYAAADDLAATLIAAKTEEARKALLAAEKELLTVELVHELLRQGECVRVRENETKALDIFHLAHSIAEQVGDKALIAMALGNIGFIYFSQGDYGHALEIYQRILAQFEALEHKAGIAATLTGIGLVHDTQGNYGQALEYYQKSLNLQEQLGDKDGVAEALLHIGMVHILQGNYALALEFYQKSLKMKEDSGNQAGIDTILNNIGIVHKEQGNYALALEFYQKSLKMNEEQGDKAGIAGMLINIGNVHRLQGNDAQALEFFQKSLTLYETLGRQGGIATSLNSIGVIHKAQGNKAQALEYYHRSLKLSEALGDRHGMAIALFNIGDFHLEESNYSLALEFYQKSLRIAEDMGEPNICFRCHWNIGVVYTAQRQREKAIAAYQKAIVLIETLRGQVAGGEREQQRFFEDKVRPYHAMVRLLIADNNLSQAFAYAERAKARVILDVLHSGKVNIAKAMTETERERERALNNQLVSLNAQIFRESQRSQPEPTRLANLKASLQKARLDYEAFQTSLYAAHPQLKVQRGEAKPISLEEAGTLLPDAKTALLEFVVTETKTYLFVLSSPEPRTHNPKPVLKVYTLDIQQKDLGKRVTRFREQLASRDLRVRASARQLYDLLLKPAQTQWQGKTNLVIVPDGVLWELPFQALQPRENHYLIEDATLSYAPSLTVLREMMKQRYGQWLTVNGTAKPPPSTINHQPSTMTLLAFGNPSLGKETVERVQLVHRGENLSPLPEAEKEVKALGQLYGATRSKVYVGADAREERVKSEAGVYRILHFATHGLLNDRTPMYSQVLLAQSVSQRVNESTSQRDSRSLTHLPVDPLTQAEDGLLEAWELMNLNLKADLAVLSACETARGRVGAGEGVIGLTWALFVAGCPTTVVSQWKVADSSTSQLMVEFHRQLPRQSKAEALRQAQLKLMKDGRHAHPFYRAAFVLVGDGR